MSNNNNYKCPVCGKNLIVDQDYMEGHVLLESHYTCVEGHYYADYEYGVSRLMIASREWSWSYQTPEDEMRRINDEIFDYAARMKTHQ